MTEELLRLQLPTFHGVLTYRTETELDGSGELAEPRCIQLKYSSQYQGIMRPRIQMQVLRHICRVHRVEPHPPKGRNIACTSQSTDLSQHSLTQQYIIHIQVTSED